MQVEIWSDVVCPWCYLGKRRFEDALERFAGRDGVEVVYRSFELDPLAEPGVTEPTLDMLAGKYGMTIDQARDAQRQMEQRAADEGLTFRLDGQRRGSTRDAHRLLQLARTTGQQAELMERLHRAYFTEQDSIFDHEALTRLAVEAGLDGDEVASVLSGSAYSDHVDTDEAMARELGASGVPLFVIDRRYGVSGAQPADTISLVLERAWTESRANGSGA